MTTVSPAASLVARAQRGLDHAIADQIDPWGEVDWLTLEVNWTQAGLANS